MLGRQNLRRLSRGSDPGQLTSGLELKSLDPFTPQWCLKRVRGPGGLQERWTPGIGSVRPS